ncbi:P-loop containing nucleoside triphosphate hydrolase protein [Clohesyomyces aquaticus]|uniref:p-loop containing nucleoside triphosphate hydrolase protein n=1 Tax=Clohesyomyces aquaticus TaxID=1231657 RepID=A0A1Y2A543_9PLEO|nr:P-loop containing nucleoside triphosphate hydrolase protein [Clohesyomyces aquaticus]
MSLQTFKDGWKVVRDSVCNSLTPEIAAFFKKHAGADLIIVTGPAGVGKSSLIKCVTGRDLYIASTLKSGTTQTALVPAVIKGRRYLFLDMPGFNANDMDDFAIFRMLMTAMATIECFVRFRGLIYVDDFNATRMTPAARKILEWTQRFCGHSYMPNVTIVTTKWDGLNEKRIAQQLDHFQKLTDQPLMPFVSNGAERYHHGLIRDGDRWKVLDLEDHSEIRANLARNMIHDRYGSHSGLTLQVYDEIASGCTIETTSAGQWLARRNQTHTAGNTSQESNTRQSPGSSHDDSARGPPRPTPENPQPGTSRENSEQEPQRPTPENSQPRSSTFWSKINPEDIQPWIKLLDSAIRVYLSQGSSYTFSGHDGFDSSDMFEEGCFADEGSFFEGNGAGFAEDHFAHEGTSFEGNGAGFYEKPVETSWCSIM